MRFFDIYPLAKAAYRRANGGTYAPSVHEEVETKFNLQEGPGICGNIIVFHMQIDTTSSPLAMMLGVGYRI